MSRRHGQLAHRTPTINADPSPRPSQTQGSHFQKSFLFVVNNKLPHQDVNVRKHVAREYYRKEQWRKRRPFRRSLIAPAVRFEWRRTSSSSSASPRRGEAVETKREQARDGAFTANDGDATLRSTRRRRLDEEASSYDADAEVPRAISVASSGDSSKESSADQLVFNRTTQHGTRFTAAFAGSASSTAAENASSGSDLMAIGRSSSSQSSGPSWRSSSSPSVSPFSWGGSFDPFGNYPLSLDHDGHCLVNYYKTTIPGTLFKVDKESSFTIQRNIFFPLAMREKTWFVQMLASASKHRDRKWGLLEESPTTIRYMAASIHEINVHISNPETRYSDEAIGAVSNAAYIEHANGWGHSFQIHARALTQMFRQRRRLNNIHLNLNIETITIVHYLTYCKAHVMTLGEGAAQGDANALADLEELKQDKDELVALLQHFVLWDGSCAATSAFQPLVHQQRQAMFGRESLVMRLIRAPLRLSSEVPQHVEMEESYQLFALCYLTLALWEYHNDPENCARFLAVLTLKMAEHCINEAYTTSRLVWILMRFVDDERPERRWNAMRMVKVFHLLKPGTKALVMCFLLGLLDPKGSETYGVRLSYELVEIIGEEITRSLADLTESGLAIPE